MRQCVGCGEMKEKKSLIRVIRTPEGEILLDESGKANGRGVYLCPKKSCLQKARKAKRLERNLKVAIPDEIWAQLEAKLEQ